MTFGIFLPAVTLIIAGVTSALAEGVRIEDAYFRTSSPVAKSGAAFFEIVNETESVDRLISAQSDVAKRVELHTHINGGDGVMLMREVEGGFIVEPNKNHVLMRGGDHVMFMGLTRKITHGDVVTVTLTFENAGDVVVDIPVDLERKPAEGATHN